MTNNDNRVTGTYLTRDLDKTYVINTRSDIGSKAHEIIHGSQVSQGLFDIDYNGNLLWSKISAIDREDPAYRAEYAARKKLPFSTNGFIDKDFRNKTLEFMNKNPKYYGPNGK